MKPIERTFKSWDGTELFYRGWFPEYWAQRSGCNSPHDSSVKSQARNKRTALLLFHRGHEHSGRWQEFAEQLGVEETAIFAWDARGHGRSPGERGSAENLSAVIKDVDAFVRHVATEHGIAIENMIILAHSVGAVTVTAWVHDYAPPIRGLILATAAFRVKLYVPFAVPLLRLKQRVFGPGFVKSYIKAKMLTHDSQQAASYQSDPLIFRQIAVNVLLDLFDTSTRLLADAGAIRVPTLMLCAGSDRVVQLSAQQQFFQKLSSSIKELEIYDGFFHAIFHEHKRSQVIERIRRFCRERFQEQAVNGSLVKADRQGYTRAEYDRLSAPGGFRFRVMKVGAKIGGWFSEGIKLGWRSGFDSGLTLDYVYENRPRGMSGLGRLIDRFYLESVGWRGIRQRRIHLEKMLWEIIVRLHRESHQIRILDIAAGPGRYVLETLRSLPEIPVAVVLRDYKTENVEAARKLAEAFGLKNVTSMPGDAFDRASLAATSPRPTIAIVSGLYELFPGNEPVLNSLRGLADAIEPGGYLIYTNQPWHPQIEFIARVLTNREGKPWIMRRRTQAEMDELVREAGFEKIAMEIDQWGIFTVSLAKRSERSNQRNSQRAEHHRSVPRSESDLLLSGTTA